MNLPDTNLRRILKRKKLDAIFISNPANVSYLSGFKGGDSFLLIAKDKGALFITDSRYLQQAEKEIRGFEILCLKQPIINKIPQVIKKSRLKRVGFESAHLSYKYVKMLNAKTAQRLIPIDGVVEKFRIIKNKAEIKIIKKSAKIAKKALKKTISHIKAGMNELEVAGYLEWRMRKEGAEKIAFPLIVASGANSAMPHAVSSRRRIKKQEPVMIDCGCVFGGYNSDLTRTIFLGRINAQLNSIYNTVKGAQEKAISLIRPGVKISAVDKAARDYIRKKGLGKYFGHATGHGIGREIHEAPAISGKNPNVLKKGMVFTVEPGVYIPGLGGVRIEDMVLVTNKSCEVLT